MGLESTLIEQKDELKEKLKEVFGYGQFRGNQEVIIKNILNQESSLKNILVKRVAIRSIFWF